MAHVRWAIAVTAVVGSVAAWPSAQTPASPAFEVASVKPAKPEALLQKGFGCVFGGGGRFMAFGTAQWLIACAYGIPQARAGQEISGAPRWLADDLFDIVAKSPADSVPRSGPEGLVMLRTLLADRFKLAVHRETKELPMYALVMARRDGRPGPQLRPTAPECAAWLAGGRRSEPPRVLGDVPCGFQRVNVSAIRGSAMTMARLADMLSPRVERPVQDRTGLAGNFELELQWRPEPGRQGPADAAALDGPSIFTALQEQLGLKLESVKGPVDVLVIDRVERPTED